MPEHRVAFNQSTFVHLVPCHQEMSLSEHRDSWYSPEDLDRIQNDLCSTIKAMRRRRLERNNEEVCERGLEHLRSAAHIEQRKINKDCCETAVMQEQRRQFKLDIINEEELANASRMGSKWSRDLARQVGLEDEASVRRISINDIRSFQWNKVEVPDARCRDAINNGQFKCRTDLFGRVLSLCDSERPTPNTANNANVQSSDEPSLARPPSPASPIPESVLLAAARSSSSPFAGSGVHNYGKLEQQPVNLKSNTYQAFGKAAAVASGGFRSTRAMAG